MKCRDCLAKVLTNGLQQCLIQLFSGQPTVQLCSCCCLLDCYNLTSDGNKCHPHLPPRYITGEKETLQVIVMPHGNSQGISTPSCVGVISHRVHSMAESHRAHMIINCPSPCSMGLCNCHSMPCCSHAMLWRTVAWLNHTGPTKLPLSIPCC